MLLLSSIMYACIIVSGLNCMCTCLNLRPSVHSTSCHIVHHIALCMDIDVGWWIMYNYYVNSLSKYLASFEIKFAFNCQNTRQYLWSRSHLYDATCMLSLAKTNPVNYILFVIVTSVSMPFIKKWFLLVQLPTLSFCLWQLYCIHQ